MVRPRFANLPAQQQQAILRAALQEFAAHGFHDASLNRVIEAAGISKGSLYYYFDDKEDLYAYVAQVELEQLFTRLGPFPVPGDADADAFWSTVAGYYLRLMTALIESPQLATLIRGWLAAAGNPALQRAQEKMEQAVLPWMTQTLATGQRAGAVRTDLPATLLMAVIFGMGQAMDTWLMTQQPDPDDLPELIDALIDMIRRTVEP
jgi:AcrR family transcriptional regulator